MTLLARLRRLWLDVHLWLGVGLAVVMIPLGLSGSVLVWHDQIDPLVYPHRYAVTEGAPLQPSAYFDAARTAFGDAFAPSQVRMPEEAGHPVLVTGTAKRRASEGQRPETRTVFLDPATARVLDVANTRGEFWGLMHTLHGSLFIPDVGRQVVGYLGWALFSSCVTGLWLWWPRNAFFKGFRWRRSPSTNFNLHHMMGFWIAIPLAIVALTGVFISFPQPARQLTAMVLPMSPAPARAPGPPGGGAPLERTRLSADQAVAAALASAPEGELASISAPTRGRRENAPATWRVGVRMADERAPQSITVNDATGKAELPEARAQTPGDGIPLLMRRIHDGVEQHLVWQVLVFLTGLAPLILGVTGTVMWLRRSARLGALRKGAAKSPV